MKHTPKPWFYDFGYIRPRKAFSNLENPAIAEVFDIGPDINGDENGPLIAAAPDMLEACEAAFNNLKPAYPKNHLVMVKLAAAIKKAKGE
jgi:hypothetical protein